MENKIESIGIIIAQNRLIKDRVEKIKELGTPVGEYAMGSGGVGQIKYFPRINETRIQIGCGHGRYNYAMCAIIEGKINKGRV